MSRYKFYSLHQKKCLVLGPVPKYLPLAISLCHKGNDDIVLSIFYLYFMHVLKKKKPSKLKAGVSAYNIWKRFLRMTVPTWSIPKNYTPRSQTPRSTQYLSQSWTFFRSLHYITALCTYQTKLPPRLPTSRC